MERGNSENRMYIWEQIQFEWISSKLEMGNSGLPIPGVTDLSFSLLALPFACSFTVTRSLFPSIFFLFYLIIVRPLLHIPILSSYFPFFSFYQSCFRLCLTEYRQSKWYFRMKIPQQQRETFHFEWFPSMDASLCSYGLFCFSL